MTELKHGYNGSRTWLWPGSNAAVRYGHLFFIGVRRTLGLAMTGWCRAGHWKLVRIDTAIKARHRTQGPFPCQSIYQFWIINCISAIYCYF